MCGRYTHKFTWRELHDLLSLGVFPARLEIPGSSFNVAPTHMVPVLRRCDGSQAGESGEPGQIEGLLARWGFIPAWWREESPPDHTINARAEGVAASRMFSAALKGSRCVVPASGFYEWQGKKPPKTPLYITRADGKPMLFAGLLSLHKGMPTMAILTTSASEEIAPIHDRMPVVLEPEEAPAWLDPDSPPERIQALMDPAAAGTLVSHAVSPRVNSPRNNAPDLIEPAREPEAPPTRRPPTRAAKSKPGRDDQPGLFSGGAT
ncbi:MAG: SOS response-associated peptidase family protein [Phycisphaerales bacterium]